MTRLQAVGVLLVALGLIYALLYLAWLRKQRRHTSAAVVTAGAGTGTSAAGTDAARTDAAGTDTGAAGAAGGGSTGRAGARLVVEGTYVSTTTAVSRLERVTVEGLGNRARATLTVNRGNPEELVRIERQGESTVVVTAARLVSVRRDGGMVGKFVGSNRMLVLQWRSDDDALYETGFLPRYKADVERVESALWWHTGQTSTDEAAPMTPETDSPANEGKSAP